MAKEHFLTVTAMGAEDSLLAGEIADAAAMAQCTILNSHLSTLGNHTAGVLFLQGTWHALAKFEGALRRLQKRLPLSIHFERSQMQSASAAAIPCQVQVVALDKPGIMDAIYKFFASNEMSVLRAASETYQTPFNCARMVSITCIVNLAHDAHLASVREAFMVYCDERNFDGFLEPQKI